ncbi:hypothetical protein AVEN_260930-1 [Araneus ventricosus]|uniref:Uncharacterized protein n=1 Tax=Araneus ventricosus TaxID=182803 RepID=A0A4Y2WJN4_ARAVE|nr:hypothetical protein AVEN_260930-1 [Araneus ventricosus]
MSCLCWRRGTFHLVDLKDLLGGRIVPQRFSLSSSSLLKQCGSHAPPLRYCYGAPLATHLATYRVSSESGLNDSSSQQPERDFFNFLPMTYHFGPKV